MLCRKALHLEYNTMRKLSTEMLCGNGCVNAVHLEYNAMRKMLSQTIVITNCCIFVYTQKFNTNIDLIATKETFLSQSVWCVYRLQI